MRRVFTVYKAKHFRQSEEADVVLWLCVECELEYRTSPLLLPHQWHVYDQPRTVMPSRHRHARVVGQYALK